MRESDSFGDHFALGPICGETTCNPIASKLHKDVSRTCSKECAGQKTAFSGKVNLNVRPVPTLETCDPVGSRVGDELRSGFKRASKSLL